MSTACRGGAKCQNGPQERGEEEGCEGRVDAGRSAPSWEPWDAGGRRKGRARPERERLGEGQPWHPWGKEGKEAVAGRFQQEQGRNDSRGEAARSSWSFLPAAVPGQVRAHEGAPRGCALPSGGQTTAPTPACPKSGAILLSFQHFFEVLGPSIPRGGRVCSHLVWEGSQLPVPSSATTTVTSCPSPSSPSPLPNLNLLPCSLQ